MTEERERAAEMLAKFTRATKDILDAPEVSDGAKVKILAITTELAQLKHGLRPEAAGQG